LFDEVREMKRIFVVGIVLAAAASRAFAADLPQPASLPPQAPAAYVPTIAPVYNWGGIYVGINGGYGFGSSEWSNPIGNGGPPVVTSTGTFNVSGFLVGPTLGANFQSDAFVFGVEGDFDPVWISGTSTSAFCASALGGASCKTQNTWLATARARVGYAADRVLFYATGGGAFGNIQSGVSGNFQSSTEPGWTAGAGVEAAFTDNWTARAEYLYFDLESATCSAAQCGAPAGDSIKFSGSLIRLGLDYKFRF
jgi:outer membrane immunogenic protein